MTDCASWIGRLYVRDLQGFESELALFPDEALIWKTVDGVTNPAGTLALHVCGNLQHFVGHVLGGTTYVRNRDLEFSARGLSRDALLRELHATTDVVGRIMSRLTDDDLAREYPEAVGGVRMVTGQFLTHLSAHLAFHLGQAGYLRRALTGDPRSSGAVPLTPLAM
jgi:uncharacterized damage-inducible protein DinB